MMINTRLHRIKFTFHSSHLLSSHLISSPLLSSHVMSCHVMSCHVMSCHVMSCHLSLLFHSERLSVPNKGSINPSSALMEVAPNPPLGAANPTPANALKE